MWAAGDLLLTSQDDDDQDAAELEDVAEGEGLRIERDAAPVVDVFWLWPENWPLWDAWLWLQTQWRLGAMGERRGLDYAACAEWLRLHGWSHGRRRSLREAMRCIAAMERVALEVWRERDERDARNARRGRGMK